MTKRVAVVTGAASGFGFASAQRLGGAGYHVVLIDVRSEAVEDATEKLKQTGIAATALAVDLGAMEQVASIRERLGVLRDHVAVLVNNAAISPKRDGKRIPLADTQLEDDWDRALRVNLTAPFLLSQSMVGAMRARGWGRIINVSSSAARAPSGAAGLAYVATKTGLLGLTRALAQEVARDGITVNSVAPGRFETTMGRNMSPELLEKVVGGIPVGRWGEPEEVAALIAFLASDDAKYITGAVIDINGGVPMV